MQTGIYNGTQPSQDQTGLSWSIPLPNKYFHFFLVTTNKQKYRDLLPGILSSGFQTFKQNKKYIKRKITDKQTQKRGGHCCFFVCYFFSNYSNKHQNKQKIKEQNKNKNRQTNRNAGSCCRRGRPQGTAAGVGAGNSIVQRWRFSSADVSTYCLLLSCTLFLIYFGYETYEDL